MPEETERTTGTQAQDDGDAAETQTTGTPEAEGRDAAQEEPDYKTLYLVNKAKAERVNEVEAELAELRGRNGSHPAAEAVQAQSEIAAIEADNRELERLAPVDPVARSQIRSNNEIIRLKQGVIDAFTAYGPIPPERAEYVEFYNKNRHLYADLNTAEKALKDRKDVERLTKELEEAKKGKSVDREDREDVVRTHGRDLSTPAHKARTMTDAQWEDEQARLKAEDRYEEARARQGQLRRGEIVLKR